MPYPSQEVTRELFYYNPATGELLYRHRSRNWFKNNQSFSAWNNKYGGNRAGFNKSTETGYERREVSIFGRQYIEHRIIWIYMMGFPIPDQIDHINHDATDNRWENISSSSRRENSRNVSRYISNTSGVTGVYWSKASGKWAAQCKLDGKQTYLGLFDRIEDAEVKVLSFREAHGFHKNHGNRVAPYHDTGRHNG